MTLSELSNANGNNCNPNFLQYLNIAGVSPVQYSRFKFTKKYFIRVLLINGKAYFMPPRSLIGTADIPVTHSRYTSPCTQHAHITTSAPLTPPAPPPPTPSLTVSTSLTQNSEQIKYSNCKLYIVKVRRTTRLIAMAMLVQIQVASAPAS